MRPDVEAALRETYAASEDLVAELQEARPSSTLSAQPSRGIRRWVVPVLVATAIAGVVGGVAALAGQDFSPTRVPVAQATRTSAPGPRLTPVTSSPAGAVGVPFRLYTHCGIQGMTFGGHAWKARSPLPDPRRLPDRRGVTTYTGYISGLVTLNGTRMLTFVVADPTVAINGQVIVFDLAGATTGAPCA